MIQINEEAINGQIKKLVRGSVEETLNEMLEQEAQALIQGNQVSSSVSYCSKLFPHSNCVPYSENCDLQASLTRRKFAKIFDALMLIRCLSMQSR